MLGQGPLEFLPGVDAPAVDGHARALVGKPFVGLGQFQIGPHDVEQVFGIGPVVDRELRRQADGLAVTAEQPGGDGVEGAAPDAARAEGGGGAEEGEGRKGKGESRK